MGTLQQIIRVFQRAFDQLQVYASLKTLEELSIMIHRAMSAGSRLYHRYEHVFALADPSDPLQTLAALYHDLIYYNVDKEFPPEIWPILAPYIQEKEGDFFFSETIKPDDRLVPLTLQVFGFRPGQRLPGWRGTNEFLSALVMNKTLESVLAEEILLQLTVYIEATIPFRGKNEQGESFTDILEYRLHNIAKTYNFTRLPKMITSILTRAVIFGNKDVANFSSKDPGEFLHGTWQLLPETNSALRSRELYTVKDYRLAMQNMEKFSVELNPDLVFHQYNGTPPEEEFQRMVEQAHINLRIAHEYLEVKLLAIAILEALAEASGGNVPLSLFLGESQSYEAQSYVDPVNPPPGIEVSASFDPYSPLFIVLDSGRKGKIDFDIQRSPLSAFLYKYQESAVRKHLLGRAKAMFDGDLSYQEFLEEIDPVILAIVAKDCASVALTRREQLLHYT